MGAGVSGFLQRLPSGDVIKTPWSGRRNPGSRRDITLEHQIYEMLGYHSRLIRIVDWDPEECALTMEYMSNGTLKDFIMAHNDTIDIAQRIRWAQEVAEGLQLLHTHEIIHSDVHPTNFLLDENLSLRVCDFSSVSLRGSRSSACSSVRFLWPAMDWLHSNVQEDIFGLGSTIYFIMTGHYPFTELSDKEVEANYKAGRFPDLTGVEAMYADIIQRCWKSEYSSIQDICVSMKAII